jgi:hypothetical protein
MGKLRHRGLKIGFGRSFVLIVHTNRDMADSDLEPLQRLNCIPRVPGLVVLLVWGPRSLTACRT